MQRKISDVPLLSDHLVYKCVKLSEIETTKEDGKEQEKNTNFLNTL